MSGLRRKFVLLIMMLSLPAVAGGCLAGTPDNMDWAAPAVAPAAGIEQDIQDVLDDYSQALVDKDRTAFLSHVDAASPDFMASQQQLYANLEAVPFDRYQIDLESYTEKDDGTAIAKVSTAYTLRESFTGMPDAVRSAYALVKREEGWKLAGDATEQALGKKRDAQLYDFGEVDVIQGDNVIVFYHPSESSTARKVRDYGDAAFKQLTAALPGIEMPRVVAQVFDDKQQIDQAFPGQWQDWVGAASRKLGSDEDDGGDIILDASLFADVDSHDPEVNRNLIAHELTHVALFPYSGARTPPFLVEGLSDYVAGLKASSALADRLRSGEPLSPSLRDLYQPGSFDVLISDESAQLAYDEADSAVAYLEQSYGREQVISLLREFKRREQDDVEQDRLVDEVFLSLLGISWSEFENGWRRYVLGG